MILLANDTNIPQNTIQDLFTKNNNKINTTKLILIIIIWVLVITAMVLLSVMTYNFIKNKPQFKIFWAFVITISLCLIMLLLYKYIPDDKNLNIQKLQSLSKNKAI